MLMFISFMSFLLYIFKYVHIVLFKFQILVLGYFTK